MLCSHQKKFIYLKTKKTASTSVEIFFEKYCIAPGQYFENHSTQQIISTYGVVGSRLDGRQLSDSYFNHMSANNVLINLGSEIFNSYLKFCVMRNPFDKLVSRFWWEIKDAITNSHGVSEMPFPKIKEVFKKFIIEKSNCLADDREVYMINGRSIIDNFLMYENLQNDLQMLCQKLKIEYDESLVGKYKSGYRLRAEHFSEYYDDETYDLINKEFEWEINRFSYSL